MADQGKSEVLGQIGQFLGGLSSRQRLLLVGGAAAVALTLWFFVRLIAEPKYTTLYSGLRPADAQTLASRLGAKNIPYQLSPDGASLLVPADRLDSSRLETASQGLPRSARLGFELFDTPNWAGSDFSEKVNYQRALEGELERTLQTLSEVEAVRVHLVLPHDSIFTEQERDAKASVIIRTRGGRLSDPAQQAIPHLVASAVDKLRPENVTVVDADSNTPLVRLRGGPAMSSGPYPLEQELSSALVHTLEPVVGAEHVRASVHVEYDSSSSEDTQEIYDPKVTAALTQQRSEETMGGASPGGIPGTASNLPGAQPPGVPTVTVADQQNQSSRSESTTYAVSKSVRRTVQPSGRLKRITAAVLVDDAVEWKEQDGRQTSTRRKRTAEELKEIEQLARAAIGLDANRGDLLAIENLSFRELPEEKLAAPGALDRWRKPLQQWAGLLRYVGVGTLFLMVYGLLLRPIKKQALAAFRELPARLRSAKPGAGMAGGENLAGEAAPGLVELPAGTEESKRATVLKRQLTEKVKSEPAAASRLVQSWIREGSAR
jgi:flagellar M-ring protein FliF